jgi:hypothetical protein
MSGKYIVGVFLALTFGFGVVYWRTIDQFSLRLQAANDSAAMVQLAGEERAKALSEKLDQETKSRETAEHAWKNAANRAADLAQQLIEQIGNTRKIKASLAGSEGRERALDARLRQEISDKEAAETARMNAEANARAAETASMKTAAEAQATIEKLVLEIKAREAALKSSRTERRASPNHHHRILVRRPTQTAALLPTKKQHLSWQPISPAPGR